MCRFSTGSLGTWFAALKGRPSEKSLSNAKAYSATDIAARYFCKNCGCSVFVHMLQEDRWIACAGIVEVDSSSEGEGSGQHSGEKDKDRYGREDRNISSPRYHEFVGSAADGGLAPYLYNLGGRDVPCYDGDPADGEKPLDPTHVRSLRDNADISASARDDTIKVACLCGGVELNIAPPSYNASSTGWYVPSDKSKYYARLCNCRSCRLTLGFTFQPWTYIPPSQLFTKSGEQLIVGPDAKSANQIDKLQYYQSSESVLRGFCETCGATMFYQSFERPYIIDVSVGVVRSKVGNVMVREWLEWDRKVVSKRDEAVDEMMIEAWLRKE